MAALNDYIARALSSSADEAESLADELQAELSAYDGLPALVVELRRILRTSLATAQWLDSIGDSGGAERLRAKATREIQPQINAAQSGALDARASLRILCGSVWEAKASSAIHALYCVAVEIAHGKGSVAGFMKKCNAYFASLQHKLAKAENEAIGTNGNGEWFPLSYLNGAAYAGALRLQMEAIPACERRATLTLDAPSEIPPSLWLWIREAQREGLAQGLPACSLGNVESLKDAFGHARVLHNAIGSVATGQREKAKAKVYYPDEKHPYSAAGEGSSEGVKPFTNNPVVAYRKRRGIGDRAKIPELRGTERNRAGMDGYIMK